eukprot:7585331-Alexandrium_andersonii.AAC.1
MARARGQGHPRAVRFAGARRVGERRPEDRKPGPQPTERGGNHPGGQTPHTGHRAQRPEARTGPEGERPA